MMENIKDDVFKRKLEFAIQEVVFDVKERAKLERGWLGQPDNFVLDDKKFENLCTKEVWNPCKNKRLYHELDNAKNIITNFEVTLIRQPENNTDETTVDGLDEANLPSTVPTLTFGNIKVPLQFAPQCHPLDEEKINRKYILLSDQSNPQKLYWLLSKVWELPEPNLILSFTGGKVEMNQNEQKTFTEVIQNISRSTGAWIFTDGLHSGVSLLLGKILQDELEQSSISPENEKDTRLIGFCDWKKLRDKTLLQGISLENAYSSCYFYQNEQDLEKEEAADILSPYHHAYVMIQSNEGELRSNFEAYLKQGDASPDNTNDESFTMDEEGEAHRMISSFRNQNYESKMMTMLLASAEAIPVITCVIGGDEHTLEQIRIAVKSMIPVIVVSKSGENVSQVSVSQCLSNIYREVEQVLPRACVQRPDLTDREINCIDNLLSSESCKSALGNTEEVRHCIHDIMRHRYLISLWDLSKDLAGHEEHLIRALYKPYTPSECMQIALSMNTISFLNPIFVREIDPTIKSTYMDSKGLIALHKVNLDRNSKLFGLNKYKGSRTPDGHILPLVGSFLFSLLGLRYQLLYQDGISELDAKLTEPRQQLWHLFIYAVLSNKVEVADYLLRLTRCPLGAALFAHKVFKELSKCASLKVDNALKQSFSQSAKYFEDLAINMLDLMYQKKPEDAFVSLMREVPFDLGPYITPLVIAADGEAMEFIQTACVQTYLQRIWMKNMQLRRGFRWMLPVLILCPVVTFPIILTYVRFEETKTPAQYVEEKELIKEKNCTKEGTDAGGIDKPYSWLWKVKSFYTAPIVKYNVSILSYLTFLCLMSYFFLTELCPFQSVSEITVVEWLCYIWVLGLIFDEFAQIKSVQGKGPVKGKETTPNVWSCNDRAKISLPLHRLMLYIKDGSWNGLDFFMLVFFIVTTAFRFCLPVETFQMVRVLYSVSIIVFFSRTLRYFYILKIIGPRIIALFMMLQELVLFLVILSVFLFSFGIAFQGLLHPQQPPSWSVLADIIWRPYWQMYGELFIGDGEESLGMGRDVGNMSCTKASEHGDNSIQCYSYIPAILLGIYLFISNILLLNLLIAIFGNTLNSVEEKSNTHWAFHQYSIVHEYYYKLWLPPPLNLLWYTFACLYQCTRMIWKKRPCVKNCCKKSTIKNREYSTYDHFSMHSIIDDTFMKNVDPAQKQALSIMKRRKKNSKSSLA